MVKAFSKDYSITIVFNSCDYYQLQRLNECVECIKYEKGMKLKCERAFFNFNIDIIDDVESTENYYAFIAHASFEHYGYHPPIDNPKLNHFFGVSDFASSKLVEYASKYMHRDITCQRVYNPLTLEPKEKVMHLVSACRLNDEVKGGKRTQELIKALDKYCKDHNRHYIWTIFTNTMNLPKIDSNNVCYMSPRVDVRPYIQDADIVLQLSNDMETYCYTLNEAWEYGVHTISTPLSVLNELPIPKGANCILEYDCSNIDDVVKHIFEDKLEPFEYHSPKSDWNKYLANGKREYTKMKKYLVRATENVLYAGGVSIGEFGGKPQPNDETIVFEDRLKTLATKDNISGKPLVVVVKEITDEETKETKPIANVLPAKEEIEFEKELTKAVKKSRKKTK